MRTAGDANRGQVRNRRGRRKDRRRGREASSNFHKTRTLNLEGLEGRSLLSASALLLPNVDVERVDSPTAVEMSCVMRAEVSPLDAASGELIATSLPEAGTPETDAALPEAGEMESSNQAPLAADDFYSMRIDQQLGSGVLANDSDPEGDPLSVRVTADPAFGQLVMKPDGLFTYKPIRGYSGSDNFAYIVHDGLQDSNEAIVNIAISELSPGELPENAPPTAGDDGYTVSEDEVLSVDGAGVLANDADADGDAITAALVDPPAQGSLRLAEDGSFEYTPNADFHGEDSFTYIANDGQADSNLATVSIVVEAVNDAPVAADDSYTVNEGETLEIEAAGVLANDTDVEGDALVVDLVDGPADGTVTISEDGSFEYTPNADFAGTDSFTYVANDGQADSNLATVSIVVEPIDLELTLEVSSQAFSSPVESVWEGSSFWVNAFVQDDRDQPLGVVGGAVDIQFDPSVAVPTGNVAYGDDFSHFQQGEADAEAGMIEETGAITTEVGVGVGSAAPFVAWEFVRTSPFQNAATSLAASFQLDAAEGTGTILPADFALIGRADPLAAEQIRMGSAEVNIYDADLNDDRAVDQFDLALFQMHTGSVSGEEAFDPSADLNGDAAIDRQDLDLLMAAMYQPASEALSGLDGGLADDASAEAGDGESELLSEDYLSAVDEYFASDLS